MATAKKRHKLKVKEPREHIEGDFDVVGLDLSLNCPGMARLKYKADTRTASIDRKLHINNAKSKKSHGQILTEIFDAVADIIAPNSVKVVARERAFSRFNNETQTLNKVVGVSEMALWQIKQDSFEEYAPLTVKKAITGWGRADKEDVAEGIDHFIPEHTKFVTDDESDAVGVALAFLIENGYLDAHPMEKFQEQIEASEKRKGV